MTSTGDGVDLRPDDAYALARRSAAALSDAGFDRHDAVVVLGSGWQSLLGSWGPARATVPMADVAGFRVPVAEGHGAEIRSYDVGSRRVLVLLGRTHLYEGLGPAAVVHGVRTAAALGCRTAILTNANGSLRAEWAPGTCMVIGDHLNLTATSPLVGPVFVDLTDAYTPGLRRLARAVRPDAVEGVYAMLPGPHYETRAEGLALRALGADVIGMSTVLETIAAREAGLAVLGLSMITVTEGGDTDIDPSEVVRVASRAAAQWGDAVMDILRQWEGHP